MKTPGMGYLSQFNQFAQRIRSRQTFRDLAGFNVPEPLRETSDLNEFLDRLCEDYLQVDTVGRSNIRDLFRDQAALWYLHEYTKFVTERLEKAGTPGLLMRTLAAVSISDLRPDFRDSLYELGYIYRTALRAGIGDPMPYFRQAADISNTEGNPSAAKIIATFDQSEQRRELKFIKKRCWI